MYCRYILLGLAFILGAEHQTERLDSQKYLHPGAIADAYTRKGIRAEAYAYGSMGASGGSGCPVYSDRLDAQTSSAGTGDFTFHIDKEKSSYVAVYCEPGYAPRTETINDNQVNNTRVQPDPITLYPTSLESVGAVRVAATAIAGELNRLQRHLNYYSEANPTAFAKASESSEFTDQERQAISTFMMKSNKYPSQERGASVWRSQKPDLRDPFVAYTVIVRDLNVARSDFNYYSQADKSAYFESLRTYFPQQKDAIEAIRTRRDPFVAPQ